jgi:hypothetical protein
MCMGRLVLRPGGVGVVVLAGLIAIQTGTSQAVQVNSEPATAAQIAAAIGNDADARAVMSMFLKEAFPPSDSPRTEFVLRSQIRDEWLPDSKGVEIVRLSEADAIARLATCGSYTVLSAQKQTDGTVRVIRRPKCSASARGTNFAIREGRWVAVGSGIGSGWIGGPPAECPRCLTQ